MGDCIHTDRGIIFDNKGILPKYYYRVEFGFEIKPLQINENDKFY